TQRFGQFVESGLRTPPVVISIPDEFRRAGAGQFVGSRPDGPTTLLIVEGKGVGVLSRPNVLRQNDHASPDTHREIVELEARIGRKQVELYREIIDLLDTL